MSGSSKLRCGVIGAGRIGAIHAGHLAAHVPGAELAAIADINLRAAQELAARLNAPDATADYHALLQDPAIQAVVICSPTDTHASGPLACPHHGDIPVVLQPVHGAAAAGVHLSK